MQEISGVSGPKRSSVKEPTKKRVAACSETVVKFGQERLYSKHWYDKWEMFHSAHPFFCFWEWCFAKHRPAWRVSLFSPLLFLALHFCCFPCIVKNKLSLRTWLPKTWWDKLISCPFFSRRQYLPAQSHLCCPPSSAFPLLTLDVLKRLFWGNIPQWKGGIQVQWNAGYFSAFSVSYINSVKGLTGARGRTNGWKIKLCG